MHRRTFLRGLGGAMVAAPYLGSVWERSARGASPGNPKQLIVMFTHYGCITTKWFPTKAHGELTATDLLATNLGPLAPFAKKLLIPRGIRAMNEWTPENNGTTGLGQGNDPHLTAVGSYFTLQPVTPNTNNPFNFDTATKFNARPVGSSLDHVIAQQLSPSGLPLFMRVGNRTEGAQSAISYLKDPSLGREAPAEIYTSPMGTPQAVLNALAGLYSTGGAMTPDAHALARGKKLCDVVKSDLADLKRMDMSMEDRRKLEVWESLCSDMGSIVPSECTADLATRLGGTAENVGKQTSNITAGVTSELDGADLYSVMAVLAAVCNYNPVIFLKYPPNYTFTGLGITVESANLSHRLDNAGLTGTCIPNALTMIQTIDRYYATKFAKLVSMLDGIKHSDGSTMLDSSAAVWFNEMSDGLAMNLNNLPIIQAGGCGGYFKTGWAVNLDPTNPGQANLHSGNSEGQCSPGGSQTVNGVNKVTGTPPVVANAPINKYYYNLMNAMGVKADASGFPARGGAAEVSKFGYSDLTTDFNGGLDAQPTAGIHSPGEFTALRA